MCCPFTVTNFVFLFFRTKKHHYDKLAELQEVIDVKNQTKVQATQYEKLKEMRQKVQKFDQQGKFAVSDI